MNTCKITQQNTFKGYKNVISSHVPINKHADIAFITMQLNDEGYKDLTELKKVRELFQRSNRSDILTLVCTKYPYLPDKLFFDEKRMYLGDELYSLRFDIGDTAKYQEAEKASLKAYSLIASLTRRMQNDSQIAVDSNYNRVFVNIVRDFSESLHVNYSEITNFILQCIKNNVPLKHTASIFNNFVVENMNKFFRL